MRWPKRSKQYLYYALALPLAVTWCTDISDNLPATSQLNLKRALHDAQVVCSEVVLDQVEGGERDGSVQRYPASSK